MTDELSFSLFLDSETRRCDPQMGDISAVSLISDEWNQPLRRCPDRSCGLCRAVLVGWSRHPRPVPIEMCAFKVGQLRETQIFTGAYLLQAMPPTFRDQLDGHHHCRFCLNGLVASVVGFALWVEGSGAPDAVSWCSSQIMCWHCRSGDYDALISFLMDSPENWRDWLPPALTETGGMASIFSLPEDSGAAEAFTITLNSVLADTLAMPAIASGPWRYLRRHIRDMVDWSRLFTGTWADLLEDSIQGWRFRTLLAACGIDFDQNALSLPALPKALIISQTQFSIATSIDVGYLAMSAIRKGHRVAHVRLFFSIQDRHGPAAIPKAVEIINETHLNPKRLREAGEAIQETIGQALPLNKAWRVAIHQAVNRILPQFSPESAAE